MKPGDIVVLEDEALRVGAPNTLGTITTAREPWYDVRLSTGASIIRTADKLRVIPWYIAVMETR